MPKTTSGGASNAWEEQVSENEDGNPVSVLEQAPVVAEEPDAAVQGEPGPEVADLPQGDVVLPAGWTEATGPAAAPSYSAMSKADLAAEAAARELPVSGTKADLAARLAEHDAATSGTEAS